MSASKPLPEATLSEQVTTRIARLITEGKLKHGERLPPEHELCRALHVGRSTLREALKSLAFAGMVEMRHGDGTYVTVGSSKLLERIFTPGLLTPENVDDLCEARIALESELVALCAQRATEAELQELENLVLEMQRSMHHGAECFSQLDVQFHLTIAASSKSKVLAHLLQTIRHLLRELVVKSQELPDARELACAHHARILAAVKQSNPRRARSAMRAHLNVFQRRYKMLLRVKDPEFRDHNDSSATGGTSGQLAVSADRLDSSPQRT